MKYKDIPHDKRGRPIAEKVRFPVAYPMLTPLKTEARAKPVTELEVREPTAGEVEIANREAKGTAVVIRIVSLAAGLSVDEVRSMGMRDYSRLSGLLLDFS